MTSGKCPHPWNKNKKGTFEKGHRDMNPEGKGQFEEGVLKYPKIKEINKRLGKERYKKKEHPFYKLNKYAQDNAIKDNWYGIGKANWKRLSKNRFEKDNHTCQKCFKLLDKHKYNCHHKNPWVLSHDNSLDNLITLCAGCHMKEEAKVRKKKIQEIPKNPKSLNS
jgi:hypothetical protein